MVFGYLAGRHAAQAVPAQPGQAERSGQS